MKLMKVEVDLSDAQVAELEAAKGDPDAVEKILRRITEEVETEVAKQDVKERKASLSEAVAASADARKKLTEIIERIADGIRSELFKDALLGVHYLLHKDRADEALELLCPVVALMNGEKVERDFIHAMFERLDAINTEREKSDCCGTA